MNNYFHKYFYFFLAFLLLASPTLLSGQQLSSQSKRAIKQFEEGTRNFNLLYYEDAKTNLKTAIKLDPGFLEAYLLLADALKATDEKTEALEVYQKVIQINSTKYPEVFFFSGLLYFETQEYPMAMRRLNHYIQNATDSTARHAVAQYFKACAKFAREAVKHPVPFSPQNMGSGINTKNDEYINAIGADGLSLYFTGRQNRADGRPDGDDFYLSKRTNMEEAWGEATKLGPPINTPGDEGALTISPDGRYLLFAGCHWPDGFGSCDIYVSKIEGEKAGTPHNLGINVNTAAWESQPSLSSDGRTLYFSSTRSGGRGKSDLWKSYLLDDGQWSKPENLGTIINTSGSEMAPFIHPDGQTLYFSSDRHIGMGGIDLYMSKLDSTGQWSKPLNLGYPLNTPENEINIVVNAAGDKAYLSADKFGGYGGFDIFEFDLPGEIRPIASTYMKGKISDAKTGQALEAYFSLIDLDSEKEVVRSFSDPHSGEFLVCIPANREYALNVSKENYLFYSENIMLTGVQEKLEPFRVNILLQPIEVGNIMVLRNIFFDTGKYDLKNQSVVELKKLLYLLNENPEIDIEIRGYTDNIGSEDFNIQLSQNRARAVFDYLIANGINRQRLQYKGYGFSDPLADNETEEGRQENRRTEIKILETGKLKE